MNSTAHRTVLLLSVSALLLGAAETLRGQIGWPVDRLAQRYGRPLLENTHAGGTRTLSYRKDNIDITANAREGVALRMVYTRKGLRGEDVVKLLELNRGGASWTDWFPPDSAAAQRPATAWLRSDDLAMAVREGDTLTVTASSWNRCDESRPATTASTPALLPSPAPRAIPPPAPRVQPLPRAKARPPAELPAPGESRAHVCRLLGRPRGEISRGSREVMLFDWGLLELEHGRVVRVN